MADDAINNGPVELSDWWRRHRARLFAAPALLLLWAGLLLSASWLRDVFTPLIIAVLLAFIFNPAVTRAERLGIPRSVSISGLYLLLLVPLLVVFYYFGPVLLDELITESNLLAEQIRAFKDRLRRFLEQFPYLAGLLLDQREGDRLGSGLPEVPEPLRGGPEGLLSRWSLLMQTVLGFLLNKGWLGVLLAGILLVGFYLFFLLRHWNDMIAAVDRHVPARFRDPFVRTARRVDMMMSDFFRGRLPIMLVVGTLTAGGLRACDVPYSVLIGFLTGLASLVPVLPLVLGFVPACISAYVHHETAPEGPWPWTATAAAVFLGIYFLDRCILTPLAQGRRRGLHPVSVVLALLIGFQVAETFGLLAALPTAALLKVVIAEFVLPPLRELAEPRTVDPTEHPNV
jgi:predicted PurR-regulated permease PerM